MPDSHFFYNGQQIDSDDGSAGIIVSRCTHEPTSDVELSASAIARGDGLAFHQHRFRAKTIRIEGTIRGTDKSDLEARIDQLNRLFADPQGTLDITNYGSYQHHIAVFEEGEAWTREYIQNTAVDDSPLWDLVHYQLGTRGLILEATTTSGATSATLTRTVDLSAFSDSDTLALSAYIPDATKLASIRLRLETTAGTNYYATTWSTGFTTGWNDLTVLRSALTTTGVPSWASIARLQLTVTATGTSPATITFDDLSITTSTDTRRFTVSLNAPIDIPREHYHVNWVPFSLTLSCSDGVGRSTVQTRTTIASTTPQQHVPLYLGGSGQQHLISLTNATAGQSHSIVLADHLVETFGSYEGRSWFSVATFEATETWTGGSAELVHVKVGSQARLVSATASTTTTASRTVTANYSALPNTMRSSLWAYVTSVANLDRIEIAFVTTAGVDAYVATFPGAGLTNGYNQLRASKRSFTATGAPDWASIVAVETRVVANASGTTTVAFDAWRWEDVLGPTGGMLTADSGSTADEPFVEIAPCLEFPSTLAYLGTVTLDPNHAAFTNRTVEDGEVIALMRCTSSGTLTHGVFARATAVTPTTARVQALASSGGAANRLFSIKDAASASVVGDSIYATTGTGWYWHRLVCRGARVQYFIKSVAAQQWTLLGECPTTRTASGYWGVSFDGTVNVAYLELIDYATQSRSTLAFTGPVVVDYDRGAATVATETLTATMAGSSGAVTGTIGTHHPDLNPCSVFIPASSISDPQFRFPETFDGWTLWGGATTQKVALKVVPSPNTYLHTRGNYLYLARDLASAGGASPPAAQVRVELYVDAAGVPSGPALAVTTIGYTPTGTALLSSLAGLSDGSGGSAGVNGTIAPIELGIADTPLTATATYWIVLSLQDSAGTPITNEQKWRVPYRYPSASTDRAMKIYNGSAWVNPSVGAASGIYLLAGNTPASSLAFSHAIAYSPTYR